MKTAREIIIAPLITEKTTQQAVQNVYTFEVSMNANKIEIKKAIEFIFNVDVLRVNTVRIAGKPKTYGRWSGYKPSWKKAVVTVKDGQRIADFDM
ncbi:MAG: 50S ribosomal protein L23 [Candidatus Cloacimonetes bacterium]|nr:50S ribosomal protein L23 [Candidatus Cloacimonadota bacterium]